MADISLLRRSPLAHLADDQSVLAGDRSAVLLSEVPFVAMVSLRLDPAGAAAARLAEVLGGPLPQACGQVQSSESHQVLWLGPDEWLVTGATDAVAMTDQLTAALADAPGLVLDVSANRTTIELAGPRAREVLQKGCPIDLHPRAFEPGRAVSTTLARVPLLLWQTDADSYRLLPRSSFADYVARWLLDAMLEFTR